MWSLAHGSRSSGVTLARRRQATSLAHCSARDGASTGTVLRPAAIAVTASCTGSRPADPGGEVDLVAGRVLEAQQKPASASARHSSRGATSGRRSGLTAASWRCMRLRLPSASAMPLQKRVPVSVCRVAEKSELRPDEVTGVGVIVRCWPTVYEAETVAFGGPAGMATVHDLFCADSAGVLGYLRQDTLGLGRRNCPCWPAPQAARRVRGRHRRRRSQRPMEDLHVTWEMLARHRSVSRRRDCTATDSNAPSNRSTGVVSATSGRWRGGVHATHRHRVLV
ncbi:lantibiotic dehydratase C-terminal domain-containing protein [Amycolatopsis sp. cmx-4-68]|uniref:lantibiotic dehydratase C-terminal domain-containing protein n=1 Tax=Amycolatopsis sp. cmx-4-68 TaxID=2790938 RepID=UPI00397C85CB